MSKHIAYSTVRMIVAGAGVAFGAAHALAQEPIAQPHATSPAAVAGSPASATWPPCPSEPVSIWYWNNPAAAGGMYNDPWASCSLPPATDR